MNVKNKMTYDLVGKTFGKLKILELTSERKHGSGIYRCFCKCGNKYFASSENLRRKHVTSCGCIKVERSKQWESM